MKNLNSDSIHSAKPAQESRIIPAASIQRSSVLYKARTLSTIIGNVGDELKENWSCLLFHLTRFTVQCSKYLVQHQALSIISTDMSERRIRIISQTVSNVNDINFKSEAMNASELRHLITFL